MKRALIVLGLSSAVLFAAAACSDKDPPVTGVPGGPGVPGGTDAGGGIPGGPPLTDGGLVLPVTDGGQVVGPITDDPYMMDDTASSGLDKATLDGLKAGGTSCATPPLYPYNDTVFPGGLLSPPIMWAGASEAAYVRYTYETQNNTSVEFAIAQSNPGTIRLPQNHWNEIVRRTKGNALMITLSTKTGGAISTCQIKVRIAQGNMNGALYYNTYNHPMANGVGAVLRLTLGQSKPDIYLNTLGVAPTGPCVSCHSVSSQGNMLAATVHTYSPAASADAFKSYAIPVTAQLQPPENTRRQTKDATFGALTPDGKLLLQMGNPQCTSQSDTFPRSPNNFPLLVGPTSATLIDTATGQAVETKGIDPSNYLWMPQFSPDGTKVVFNHAKPGGGGTDRRELAMMDFNQTTRTFSNLRVIASRQGVDPSGAYAPAGIAFGLGGKVGGQTCMPALPDDQSRGQLAQGSCSGPCYPAWPFFTPDGRGVIYSLISEPDFSVAFPGRETASKSELWYVNVDDPTRPRQFRMDVANKGLEAGDALANYYPTVLPVQVGGYFWAFWTSTRKFGHQSQAAPLGAQLDPIAAIFFGKSSTEAFKKRIWVTAIRASSNTSELSTGIEADPSFPGFYLEGQGETGNTRAFAALNPCKQSGSECTSGLDCCTGYCNFKPGAATGMCGEKIMCAKTNEKCEIDSDCCPPGPGETTNSCLGHYCGFVTLN